MLSVEIRHESINLICIIVCYNGLYFFDSFIWIRVRLFVLINPAEKFSHNICQALDLVSTGDGLKHKYFLLGVILKTVKVIKLQLDKFFPHSIIFASLHGINFHCSGVEPYLEPRNFLVHVFDAIRGALNNDVA